MVLKSTYLVFFLGLFACKGPATSSSDSKSSAKVQEDTVDLSIQPLDGVLDLSNRKLSNIHLHQVLSREDLTPLKELHLRKNRFTGDALKIVIRSEHTQNLHTLDLSYNKIGNRGLKRLAQSPLLKSVQTLNLERIDLGPKGAQALIESPYLKASSVSIGFNKLTAQHAIALAQDPNLTYLDISKANISKSGCMEVLAQTKVHTLKMSQNEIAVPKEIPNVKELWIPESRLNNEQIRQLANAKAPKLEKLYLGKIFIKDETLKELSKASWFEQLDFLSLEAPTTTAQARQDFVRAYGNHRWIKINRNDFSAD